MDSILSTVISFVEVHRFLGYIILFFLMMFEGEILLVLSGVLVHLKAFDFFDTLFIAFSGAVIGNILWYYLGEFLGSRHSEKKFITYVKETFLRTFPHLSEKPFWTIAVSKFIYGTTRTVVAMSGFLRINFLLFLRAEISATFLWTSAFLSLGYFVGYVAVSFAHKIELFLLATAFCIIGIVVFERVVRRYLEKRKQ